MEQRANHPEVRLVELEAECESVRLRIKDLEWRLSRGDPDVSEDARRRAMNKLQHLMDDLAGLRKTLIKRQILERRGREFAI